MRKRGVDIHPVEVTGRMIASTFWGRAWCDHLESFGDFANRLPRGRTYVRNGSVCHLDIAAGTVTALVSGTDMYNVELRIRTLGPKRWREVRGRCAGRIGSLIELLQGRLSEQVMAVVTDRKTGLFPGPREIEFECDCPDWADMCKHVAAVCYGVGARLDTNPEFLFRLRGVDHHDLIAADAESVVDAETKRSTSNRLASEDLGDVFGIDLDDAAPAPRRTARRARKPSHSKKAGQRRGTKAKATKKRATKSATKGAKKSAKKPGGRKKAAVGKRAAVKRKAKAKRKARAGTTTKQRAPKKKAVKKKVVKKTAVKKRAPRRKK